MGESMISGAKLAANRRNALKSTGPKTPEGKVRSSMNARTHGLTTSHFVAKGEDTAEFEKLAEAVLAEFTPRNEIERHQVERLIELLWRLRRIRLLEIAALSESPPVDRPAFQLFTEDRDIGLPVPKKYKRGLSAYDFFEFAEKVDGYTSRTWREIRKLLDDLRSNRLLEAEIVTVEAQSEVIADPASQRLKEAS
jgi:hypothetical protein